MSEFLRLGLNPQLQRACDVVGYSLPTPIQEKAIPLDTNPGVNSRLLSAAKSFQGKFFGSASSRSIADLFQKSTHSHQDLSSIH
mgnify:CR=1 FL=1